MTRALCGPEWPSTSGFFDAATAVLCATAMVLAACQQTGETAAQQARPVPQESATMAYEGTWIRTGTYTAGQLMHEEPATLVLTAATFSSSATACANSGSLKADDVTMVMTVEQSTCPSIVNVGSVVTYDYDVGMDTLTIVNNEFGAEVKETYMRE